MKVVAIGHRKLVGKDTLANFIVTILRTETRGLRIKKAGFADEIKAQVHRLFRWAGVREADYYEQNPSEKSRILPLLGKSPRDLWIGYGNRCREVYQHVWLDFLLRDPDCDILVIKDMRFHNEFDRVGEFNGQRIKLTNSRVPDTDDEADINLADVPDEAWDMVLRNDGSQADLYKFAEIIVERIKP